MTRSKAMDFEKLGAFYLGKTYELESGQLEDELLMYDARDLTTHAVCVGMTGSGKTGLCIDILEEAAIDRVPSIIIDPKGDMGNLLLTFPQLRPQDFAPWINADDARRKGMDSKAFASQQASLWKKGLAGWGQGPDRIASLRQSVDLSIYTPGSQAGLPISILQSFQAPALDWDSESELIRDRIESIVGALLALIGSDADPVRSKEHILLSTLFEHFWRSGEHLDLAKLILAVQTPPIQKLGVFDVETFFPARSRTQLAMELNNILAAPSFQNWLEGYPLDIPSLLATASGQPKLSIFSISHLSDSERMFFVTLLLNQVVAWMRTQPGTTSLRALVYMDEIFGFFPPSANPPSKKPMLTLLKQARAYGLGVVLSTQNPVDLDYKGLSNAGTWFIGRLQTERDRDRVLSGLEGSSSATGQSLNRTALNKMLSQLGKRVFLMHNVHEGEPVAFQTRWAMSYLRGPLTRDQIRTLMEPVKEAEFETESGSAERQQTPLEAASNVQKNQPVLPPDLPRAYLFPTKSRHSALLELEEREGHSIDEKETSLLYRGALLASGKVHFVNRRLKVDESRAFSLLLDDPSGPEGFQPEQAKELDLDSRKLTSKPEKGALFEDVAPEITNVRTLKSVAKELKDHLYRSQELPLYQHPLLKLTSQPGESERDFRQRLSQELREHRDEEVDKLNRKYERQLSRLEARLRKAQVTLEKKQATASAKKREVFLSVGESILGMFLGRRSTRAASSTMSKYRMSSTAKMSAQEVEETVRALQEQIETLEEELAQEVANIGEEWEQSATELKDLSISPRRTDIDVDFFGLAWVPHYLVTFQGGGQREQTRMVPAL